MRAVLHSVFDAPETVGEAFEDDGAESKMERSYTAYHEAGHAVVSEILDPGSTTLVTLFRGKSGRSGGFALSCRSDDANIIAMQQVNILVSLGSKAAQEQKFGIMDRGAESDLADAFGQVRGMVEDACYCGFNLYLEGRWNSDDLKSRIEQAVAAEIERYYRKAKEILSANVGFLDAVANGLLEKGILTMYDIADIKASCEIVPVSL